MLVLSRRLGEEVVVNPGEKDAEIIIKILEVRTNGQVRLGITAPADIPVHRREVVEKQGRAS